MNERANSRTTPRRLLVLLLALTLNRCAVDPPEPAAALTVSAAASLTLAFQEIAPLFAQETNIQVVCNFGSSGQLTRQIEQGAPVDLFAAADPAFIEELEKQGLILPDTRTRFARGHLVLWTRADSPLRPASLEELQRPDIARLALANPEHAPYGAAAQQALRHAGLWEELQPRLVIARHVRQALHYAETGNVDAALVARSLVQPGEGRWVLVDEELYPPIVQALAVVKNTKYPSEARAFAAFLNTPRVRAILYRYGFLSPDGAP